jgi:exodeoxyribonuclease VII large subunit
MSRASLLSGDDPYRSMFESVSALTERVKDTLEADFDAIAVHGEVTNLARPRSGHIYFNLRDTTATIRAVMWKGDAQRLVFDLADGLAVRLLGRLTVYAPRGDYQVVVRHMEPEGMGALQLALRQLHARLSTEGLFDPERKRPLPRFPRRIVIVSSPTGAAVRDLLQVTARRWNAVEIVIAPTRVQGVGAGAEIAAALAVANRVAGADLVILARGGGAAEDLGSFNEEIVVRAIVGSQLPVISAVGHEIDVTLSDLAADRRALTPSEAGEIAVPDSRETGMYLDGLAERLRRISRDQLVESRARLDDLAGRARSALQSGLDRKRNRLDRLQASLAALSPEAVLSRGYSLTFRADDSTLLRSADQVEPGQLVVTRLAAGRFSSRVEPTPGA